MRVLVTGGAGFIGSHVARATAAAGHEVTLLDSFHPQAHGRHAVPTIVDGLLAVHGDVRDRATVDAALRGVDVVVHHAAMVGMGVDLADLPEYVSCNDLGTAVVLAAMAAAGISRFVLASSMVVYGEGAYACPTHGPMRPPARRGSDLRSGQFEPRCPTCDAPLAPSRVDEDARLEPRSVYAATKLAQEHLATAWAIASGGSAFLLRYHNVYGPGMPRDTPYAGVAAIFRSALQRGEAPRVFEDGNQLRDFVHVADVAAANVRAVAATADRRPIRAYNIASGVPTTIGQMAAILGRGAGISPTVTGEFRTGDVRHILASPERAREELGFVARIQPDDGIAQLATAPLRDAPGGPGLTRRIAPTQN